MILKLWLSSTWPKCLLQKRFGPSADNKRRVQSLMMITHIRFVKHDEYDLETLFPGFSCTWPKCDRECLVHLQTIRRRSKPVFSPQWPGITLAPNTGNRNSIFHPNSTLVISPAPSPAPISTSKYWTLQTLAQNYFIFLLYSNLKSWHTSVL